ncbi:MAG TPA: protease inhibitor I42 family protein, partial [Candidatus Caenarcaniphilales bacterium]
RDDLKADPLYSMLLQSNPNLSVWPGDRWNTRYPVSKKLPGGRQQFLVVYQLQTCHACARLGEATFAFNFDATGKFDGVDLSLVNAASAAGDGVPKAQKPVIVSTSASKPVELAVGQPLNIRLETNPTTGYQWQLAAPFNQAVLKFTSSQQLGAQTGLLGAGSQEILGFKAMGRGETFISLKYVRPWENNALPAKAVTVKVVVK